MPQAHDGLELEPKIDKKVDAFCSVGVAQCATNGAEQCLIIIGQLVSHHGAMFKKVFGFLAMLCGSYLQQYVVFGSELFLKLELARHKTRVGKLQMVNTDERHLLLYIVAEPLPANHVLPDEGDFFAKEHSSIQQGLERQSFVQAERDSPRGTKFAEALMAFITGEVVGEIGIFCIEFCATCGEGPSVFGVEVEFCVIAEIVVILDRKSVV